MHASQVIREVTLLIHSTHPTLSSTDDSKLLLASRVASVVVMHRLALILSKGSNCASFSVMDFASLILLLR